nr:BppU family phage baseplate upper protein [Bacillus cereus group sp. BfR-BA-01448]
MAEILKIREITIDTMQHKEFNVKEEELKLIRFYQNDLNSAKLLINVTHDKVVTDFSSATSVQIAFLKPDCKRVFQDVQNVNQMQGKYYVVLSTQTLIAYGNVIAQLRFTFPNNKVIETCKFAFTVDESIMSDEAMKSTNEFPVIQKAIEAGKKFEGIDIDGIIAAGELAKGALPKTGGTMTGNLKVPRMETTDMTPLIFNGNNSNRSWKWDMVGDNLSITPTNIGAPGWDSSKAITFQTLVKNNEIYKGWIQPNGRTIILREGDDLNNVQESGIYGGPKLVNAPTQDYLYIEVLKYHDANYVMQRATTLTGSTMGSWVRRKTGVTWNPWERLIDSKGGVLSGDLYLDRAGNVTKKYAFLKDGVETFNFYNFSDTHVGLRDVKNNKNVWEYNTDTNSFDILSGINTNLVRKTGDRMSGDLLIDRPNAATHRNLRFDTNGTADVSIGLNTSGKFLAWDQVGGNGIWEYDKANKAFNVLAPNTNLMKKTGDTATGHMIFRHNINQETADGLKGVNMVVNSSVNKWSVAPKMDGNPVWANEFAMDLNTGKVTVPSLGTKKDGRANISITADGELISGNGVIADRRGNTVTLRAGVRRKVDIPHTNAIFTLPVDMRPLLTVQQNTISTDGTPCLITIQTNGEFSIQNVGSNNAQGKDYYVTISYVVD